MTFKEQILKRESCRKYENRPVEREKIVEMIEAARLAPSACNSQPWKFVVVDETEKAKQIPVLLQVGGFNYFADDIPAFIVICETTAKLMSKTACDSQHYAQMDVGLATANLTLAATDVGLSTCIMGCFDEEKVKHILDIPKDIVIRLILGVGYAKEGDTRVKVRKPIEEICTFNKW